MTAQAEVDRRGARRVERNPFDQGRPVMVSTVPVRCDDPARHERLTKRFT